MRASAARMFGTRTLAQVAMSATVAGPNAPRWRRTTRSYAASAFGALRSLAGAAICRASCRCSKRAPDGSQTRPLVATAAQRNQLRSRPSRRADVGRCSAMCSRISSRVRGVFAANRRTLAWTSSRSRYAGPPGGRQAPNRPSSVARLYAGYSRAETRWRVARMSVALTIAPRSISAERRSRLNPKTRVQSATYGDGGHCPWRHASRSTASTTPIL